LLELRTGKELKALVMREIRKHPECDNIQGVAIRVSGLHGKPWDVGWLLDKPTSAPAVAIEIACRLQQQYSLMGADFPDIPRQLDRAEEQTIPGDGKGS
jgi:hypothetical protein